jgi:hypothetical protein
MDQEAIGVDEAQKHGRASLHEGRAPNPRASRRRQRWMIPALSLIVLISVGAGVGAWALTRGHASSLEPIASFAADGFPSKVSKLEVEHLSNYVASPDAPPAFMDSALAEMLCGGIDVAGVLFDARGRPLEELEARGFLSLFNRDGLREGLVCGGAARGAIEGESLGALTFGEDGDSHVVVLLRGQAMNLPFPQHRFSGLHGFCEQAEGESDCLPEGHAAIFRDGRWAFGKATAVEAYARAWTSTRRIESTHVEIARSLLDRVEGADRVKLFIRPTSIALASACGSVAPHSLLLGFLPSCFPQGDLEQVTKAIEAKTRGFAFETDDALLRGRIRIVYTFLARDEDAAAELERDVSDLHRDWLSHLDNHEAELVHLIRESKLIYRDHWETKLNAFVRALGESEIERDGDIVRLTLEANLSDSERRAMMLGSDEETRALQAIAELVEAVIEGEALPADALTHVVGEELATYMSLPRATQEDCAALRERLAALVAGGVPTELFGAKFSLEQRFADAACVGSPLPTELRTCEIGADSIAAMQGCAAPPTPFESYWRGELRGQWAVETLEDAPGFNRAQRRSLETIKLEVADGRVAFELEGIYLGALEVESSATSTAHLRLPFVEAPIEAQVERTDAGLRLTALGGTRLLLRRATFERSLFAQAATAGEAE